MAYVTTCESLLFSSHDVLFDSQASVNVYWNKDLLKSLQKSPNEVILNGVQANANGVVMIQEGDFEAVGKVYYSPESTANILSYAVMVEEWNDVTYDKAYDRFLLKPKGSETILSFCR